MEKQCASNELESVEAAVYAAVAYRDVFDYPPTIDEIHNFLPFQACSKSEVEERLSGSPLVPHILSKEGDYVALKGREQCFETRRRRGEATANLWRRARKFARLLATVPFVEMVAVSGSLAVENPGDDADIDFFLLIRAGHLWRTRLLVRLLRRLDFAVGTRTLCPNSMRTTAALKLPFETLYMAQELMQLCPLYGYDTYRDLIDANAWQREYLPNARIASKAEECRPYSTTLRRLLEWMLDTRLGAMLERRFAQKKIREFSEPGHVFSAYSPFAEEYEGLNLQFAEKVESQFDARLKASGLSLSI